MTIQTEETLLILTIALLLLVVLFLIYRLQKIHRLNKYLHYLDKQNWKLKEEITRLKKKNRP